VNGLEKLKRFFAEVLGVELSDEAAQRALELTDEGLSGEVAVGSPVVFSDGGEVLSLGDVIEVSDDGTATVRVLDAAETYEVAVDAEDLEPASAADLAELKGAELERFNRLHPRNPDGTFREKGGGSGSNSSGAGEGKGSDVARTRRRYGSRDDIRTGALTKERIDRAIDRANVPEKLKRYRQAIRQAAKVAAATGNFDSAWIRRIPEELRGEAKTAVATILESLGFGVRYRTYEDGSRAPAGITKRPDIETSEAASLDEYLEVALAARDVTPEAKKKLKGILAKYAREEHPFTACMADNKARFGEEGARKVCATLKDLIEGNTKWRGKEKPKAGMSEAELAEYEVPGESWTIAALAESAEASEAAVDLAATTSKPWNGSASRFTDEQYRRSCLLDRGGDGPVKSRCSLPVREPDGTLNVNALKAARAALSGARGGLKGVSEEQKKQALARLKRLYSEAGMEFSEDTSFSAASLLEELDLASRRLDAFEAALEAASDTGMNVQDRSFLKQMIAHHRQAVKMARKEIQDGADRRALSMARDIVRVQSAEIEKMSTWLGGGSSSTPKMDMSVFAGDEPYALAQGMGRTNYKPEAWVRATVLHLEPPYGDEPRDPAKHSLPIRKPDGSLSLEAMKEAEKKLMTLDSIPAEKRREAARELVRAYRNVNENPSDALKGLAGEMYYRDFSTGQEVMFTGSESVLLPVIESSGEHTEVVELAGSSGSKKRKLFWKDLLPVGASIGYSGGTGKLRTISFSKKDLETAVKNIKSKVLSVPFVMVNDANRHSDAPELARGVVKDARIKGKHMQVLIEPRTDEAEKFLTDFPEVGISAKYHPDYFREADGKRLGPTILHAAATWRPHIPGMGLWQAVKKAGATLSGDDGEAYTFSSDREVLLDLTGEKFDVETSDVGGDPGNAPEGNQKGGAMKVEIRDGKVVFLSDDGEVLELSAEDRKKYAAAFGVEPGGAGDEGPTVAELSQRLAEERLERRKDKIRARADEYIRRGLEPAVIDRLVVPLANFAAENEEATAEVVELSQKDGQPVEKKTQVKVSDLAWQLADTLFEAYSEAGKVVEFGERGDGAAESAEGQDEEKLVERYAQEHKLSFEDAATKLAERGEIRRAV